MHFDLVGMTEEKGWTIDKCLEWARNTPEWYTKYTVTKEQQKFWNKEVRRIFKTKDIAMIYLDYSWKEDEVRS